MWTRYRVPTICSLLLLAVGLVFGQTVGYGFVNFDDGLYVYDNPQISGGLSAEGIEWVFTHSHGANWHPLTGLSHLLDCQLYGLHAGGHHLTNLLLHAATAIVLFLVLRRMTGGFWPSALVAGLFAVHPLRVESVAWISERKDVLSGLFFVLTLAAYVRYVRGPFSLGRYLLVAGLFALGLMAKPMLVTLPLVLLLLDYWPLGRMTAGAEEHLSVAGGGQADHFFFPQRLLLEKLPLLLLAVTSCLMTLWAQGAASALNVQTPLGSRIANALVSCVGYMGQLFYPVGLAAYYPHPEGNLPAWKVLGALVVLACLSAGVATWRRRYPYLLVGWLWYVGMLVPVIGLVQVGKIAMADRYTYLPQIGLCIALAWGAIDVCRPWPYRRWLCGVTSGLVLAVLMGCAWRQTSFWRDSETLWPHTIACASSNYLAHNNLGIALAGGGQVNEAVAHYRKALEIKPDYAEAHNNLANVLARQGRSDEAIAHYRKSLEIQPNAPEAYYNLANVLAGCGRLDEAVVQFRAALEIAETAEGHDNLGNVLARLGRFEEALAEYRNALQMEPDFVEPHNSLAWLRATCPVASLRNGAEAIAHAQQADRLCGGRRPDVLDSLAAAYAEAGWFPEAVAAAHKALDLASRQHKPALAVGMSARIALYEAGKPYRETWSASAPSR